MYAYANPTFYIGLYGNTAVGNDIERSIRESAQETLDSSVATQKEINQTRRTPLASNNSQVVAQVGGLAAGALDIAADTVELVDYAVNVIGISLNRIGLVSDQTKNDLVAENRQGAIEFFTETVDSVVNVKQSARQVKDLIAQAAKDDPDANAKLGRIAGNVTAGAAGGGVAGIARGAVRGAVKAGGSVTRNLVQQAVPSNGLKLPKLFEGFQPFLPQVKFSVVPEGKKAGSDAVLFGQANVGKKFANGPFAGRTIGDVAQDLRKGKVLPDELPLDVIVKDGKTITLNNRSLTTLRRAGVKPTIIRDRTGVEIFEQQLIDQLRGSQPSDVIRIRAGEPGLSSIE